MKKESIWDKNTKLFMVLIVILVILTQTVTIFISNNIKGENRVLINNAINITYAKNTGGAFGIGENGTLSFIFTSIVILGIIVHFIVSQREKMDITTVIALSFIVSGGISNLIDRIAKGAVIDYIDISQIIKFPLFNLADLLIVIGWILLVASVIKYEIVNSRKKKELEKELEKNRR